MRNLSETKSQAYDMSILISFLYLRYDFLEKVVDHYLQYLEWPIQTKQYMEKEYINETTCGESLYMKG